MGFLFFQNTKYRRHTDPNGGCDQNEIKRNMSMGLRLADLWAAGAPLWELCLIEHIVYHHFGHIFPMNVTVWKQYSHGWSIPSILLILPTKVSLTRRFATGSNLYHHLKRQMTRFDWFYHSKTKSQQILKDLSLKIHTTIQPVFVSRKIEQELNVKETKPPIVNQQCVVYGFQCDLCDAG